VSAAFDERHADPQFQLGREPAVLSMPCVDEKVIGGIDTHKDLHFAAVVDRAGTVLGQRSFATTRQGYRALVRWMEGFGSVERVGVEQTGSYGAGVVRHLALAGIAVLEVTGPDKADRRARGKDDRLDAVAAALAALTGKRVSVAKHRDGRIEALRVLRTTRQTAVKARRAALQQLRNTIVAAPDRVRDQWRGRSRMQLVRGLVASRPDTIAFRDPDAATRIALKSLARRILELDDEIAELEELIVPLVEELAPRMLQRVGFGTHNTAQLLVTAGDNPDRLGSEASWAMLCGSAPLPASSGKTKRHRLNRGGDRAANSALHMAAVCRLRLDPPTKAYAARRAADGLSKRETLRCLKRYLARESYHLLTAPGDLAAAPPGPRLTRPSADAARPVTRRAANGRARSA
jgi:transposase